jgi:hypothetical protein
VLIQLISEGTSRRRQMGGAVRNSVTLDLIDFVARAFPFGWHWSALLCLEKVSFAQGVNG